jgi:hypothetical protein
MPGILLDEQGGVLVNATTPHDAADSPSAGAIWDASPPPSRRDSDNGRFSSLAENQPETLAPRMIPRDYTNAG